MEGGSSAAPPPLRRDASPQHTTRPRAPRPHWHQTKSTSPKSRSSHNHATRRKFCILTTTMMMTMIVNLTSIHLPLLAFTRTRPLFMFRETENFTTLASAGLDCGGYIYDRATSIEGEEGEGGGRMGGGEGEEGGREEVQYCIYLYMYRRQEGGGRSWRGRRRKTEEQEEEGKPEES